MKKSMFKNTIYKSILSFVNIVIPLLVGPYIVRLLDVELYGIYNKVFANFQLFLTVASFGIYTFGVREISKIRDDKEKVASLLTNLFTISIISNVIVSIVYIIFALFTSTGITTAIYLLMLIQIVGNIFYIEYINEALENYKFITIKTLIVKILYLGSLFIFVKEPNDIIIYTIIINGTVFLNNIISFVYAKKKLKFNFKKLKIKKYIPALVTILIISNIDLLYSQLDRVMLGNFVSNVSVTCYYIPYYIVSTLAAIPYSIINVSIPRLSYLVENEGKKEYEKVLNKSATSLLFILIPMCMGVFVLSKEIVLLYSGDKYLSIIPVLMLASIARIITGIESTLIHLVMYPNNEEKKIMKYMFIAGMVNLVFNTGLAIINKLTPFTALLTTGISELFLILLLYKFVRKKLKIKYEIINKNTIVYGILSLCFIPISLIIRMFGFNIFVNIIIIISLCVGLYGGVLLLKKDENLTLILDKVFNKFFSKFRRELK